MTISELKYLSVINDITNENKTIKQVEIAKRLSVSKVSVYNGVEKLAKDGYINKHYNKMCITDKGKQALDDCFFVIEFIADNLYSKCDIESDIAFKEAMGIVCAISDKTRSNILNYISGLKNNENKDNIL